MNAKQSLRAASKRIEELEDFNRRSSAEIKWLNKCIDSVIAGDKTYCDWCEENADCKRPIKGKGCSEWWLTMDLPTETEEETDDSQGVHVSGAEG